MYTRIIFHVASAVEPRDLIHYKDLILTQFDEITSENRMKPVNIHPREGHLFVDGNGQNCGVCRTA